MSQKRKRQEDPDRFFVDEELSGEEQDEGISSEDLTNQETEAEKRLRLAKTYLQQLKQEAEDSEDEQDQYNKISAKLDQVANQQYGKIFRNIAERLVTSSSVQPEKIFKKSHRLSLTAVAISSDDTFLYTIGKEGSIVKWILGKEGGKTIFRIPDKLEQGQKIGTGGGASVASWVNKPGRKVSKYGKYSLALSCDNQFLAVGDGVGCIHVWNATSGQYEFVLHGHKDAVTGLSFRKGSHNLYSCSYDRRVVIWSLDDRAYVDTLFGHQSEVNNIHSLTAERAVTVGCDGSIRMWKIPEESCLVFRCQELVQDAVCMISNTEWISGSQRGKLYLWTQLKKKATCIVDTNTQDPPGQGTSDVEKWIQSLAVCPGSDLLASGAGDGWIRLWMIKEGPHGKIITQIGVLPCEGFINSLQFSRSGNILMAGVGQEPRLGRWARNKKVRNCAVLFRLNYSDDQNQQNDNSESSSEED